MNNDNPNAYIEQEGNAIRVSGDEEVIDLILDPKGEGSCVDVSGTKITNVADGKAATDAVNRGQVDAALYRVFLDIQELRERLDAMAPKLDLDL